MRRSPQGGVWADLIEVPLGRGTAAPLLFSAFLLALVLGWIYFVEAVA